jgi:predicted ABC-type ATPase
LKRFVVFAGINGAGKSTLYNANPEKYPFRINSDEILTSRGGDWRDEQQAFSAGRESVRLVKEYLKNNESFSQETTLTGKTIIKNIKLAHSKGYFIEMHYVGLDSAETAIARVKKRVEMGGHGIPEDDIRRRYTESLQNLKEIVPFCNKIFVFDNTATFESIGKIYDGEFIIPLRQRVEWFDNLFDIDIP